MLKSGMKRRIASISPEENGKKDKEKSSSPVKDVEMGETNETNETNEVNEMNEVAESPHESLKSPHEFVEYKVNEKIKCEWKGSIYDAKILSVTGKGDNKVYKVHYQGWGKKYDEKISAEDAIERFKKTEQTPTASKRGNTQPPAAKRIKKTPTKPISSRTQTPVSRISVSVSNLEISIPAELVKILKKDGEMIEKKKNMPKLPARVTANKIIEEYKDKVREIGEDPEHPTVTTSRRLLTANALLEMLDLSLYSNLLYEEEWNTHNTLKKRLDETGTFTPREHYGFVHLIRLCAKLDQIFEKLLIQSAIQSPVRANIPHFLKYLNDHREEYYNGEKDYE